MAGASQASGDYRYYLQDHLGSTRNIRDGAKAPLARYAYTPYGQPTVNVGLALHVGYTGHAWDNVTQQCFAPYRYYDPSNARWLWRDPLGFVDGINKPFFN